jgi:DNA-directed RNA polymerase specialized sigma subunit
MFSANNPTDAQFTDYRSRCQGPMSEFVHRCLTLEERLVIMLNYAESLSDEEISVVLSLPVSRVLEIHEDVITRTRQKVAHLLEEQGRLVA